MTLKEIRTKDDLPSDLQALKELLWSSVCALRELQARNTLLEKEVFGRTSEKLPQPPQDPGEQMQMTELLAQLPAAPAPDAEHSIVTVAAHQRRRQKHPGRNAIPENIPTQTHLTDLSEEEKNCQACPRRGECPHKKLVYVDTATHTVVEREAPKYTRHVYQCRRYGCPWLKDGVRAPEPPLVTPIPRSVAGLKLLVFVVLSKYLYHLPLYRIQRQIFHESGGVWFTRSTMVCWIRELCVPLGRVYQAMVAEAKSGSFLHADESYLRRIQLSGGSLQAYMWVYLGADGRVPIFDYRQSRGADAPRTFLSGCSPGTYLMTDAYQAYEAGVQKHKLIPMLCMAHVRRQFVEAIDVGSQPPFAGRIVQLIGRLYLVERIAKTRAYSVQQRQDARQRVSLLVLKQIHAMLSNPGFTVLPASRIGKAIAYALNHWKRLLCYLDNGALPIDNNPVERVIRALAVGRKNWNFVASEEGGKRTAILYSILTCCTINGIDPEQYLKDTLMRLAIRTPQQSVTDLTPIEWLKARNAGHLPPAPELYPHKG